MRARSPIDPALDRYLKERAAHAGHAPQSDRAQALAARAEYARVVAERREIAGMPVDVVARDVALDGGLAARVYLPPGAPLALILHVHGGAWVAGDLASHDPFCRVLAHAAQVAVLAIAYRLAPEHPFPAALEDVAGAFGWAAREAHALGASRVVISGDSAGANLAAVVACELAEGAMAARLAGQVLLYPITDHPSGGHASYAEPAHGFGSEFMHAMWRLYAAGLAPDDPRASPLRRPSLPALPPTFVATAEYDILRDEGIAYVDKLRAAGIAVTHHHAPDMHHNFWVSPATLGRFPQCAEALDALSGWLSRTLDPGRP